MHYRDRVSRRRTDNEPTHAHELTFSCYRGYRFLEAERTRRWLIEAIERARTVHRFAVWAYVIMPEHVHLILGPSPPTCSVSAILRSIKQPVGQRAIAHLHEHAPSWLEKISRVRNGRVERMFWQSGGGYDRHIIEPRTLWRMITYVHRNPVRRGLIEREVDWPWSSARWYAEDVDEPEPPLRPDPIPSDWREPLP